MREKHQVTYKDRPVRIIAYFSTETLKVSKAWSGVFQAIRENNCQPILLYYNQQRYLS
jgi:hypothetical protein